MKKYLLILIVISSFFLMPQVYAYDFSQWRYSNSVQILGYDKTLGNYFNFTCGSGDWCGQNSFAGPFEKMTFGFITNYSFNTNLDYVIQIAETGIGCGRIGNQPISQTFQIASGSTWSGALPLKSYSCVSEQNLFIHTLTFRPVYSSITTFSFALSFGSTMWGPSSQVTVARMFNIHDITDWNQIIAGQNQTIIEQNERSIKEQQETNKNIKDNTQATKDQTDTLKDPTIDLSDGNSFFSGFSTDTYGLTSIITSPLTLIGSITNGTCTPLGLPLPYVNQTAELPCMSTIYQKYFGSFYSVYQMITFGLISYWVSVKIFNLVKDFKNPDHDEVEVFDL